MEADEIIDGLEDFFKNLSPQEYEEIKKAFSVEIEGDVSIGEYLSAFSDQYFYTGEYDSSSYKSDIIALDTDAIDLSSVFDESESKYSVNIPNDSNYSTSDTIFFKIAA